MSKHTQGPWLLDISDHDAAIHAGGTIAMVDDTMVYWKRNAHLIAAAPDLLAALENVVASSNANDGDSLVNAIQAARAAISKAKGCDHTFEPDMAMINVCTKCGVEGVQA